jgi:hypothetical protein
MDDRRFDRFAKPMASGMSRRQALKGVAGDKIGGLGPGLIRGRRHCGPGRRL